MCNGTGIFLEYECILGKTAQSVKFSAIICNLHLVYIYTNISFATVDDKLENVATARHCNLRLPDATPVLIHFKNDARA